MSNYNTTQTETLVADALNGERARLVAAFPERKLDKMVSLTVREIRVRIARIVGADAPRPTEGQVRGAIKRMLVTGAVHESGWASTACVPGTPAKMFIGGGEYADALAREDAFIAARNAARGNR